MRAQRGAPYNVVDDRLAGTRPHPCGARAASTLAVFLLVGLAGVYRYVDNFWLYRGFAPPKDAPCVRVKGTTQRLYVASPALGGRRQPVDVYLPPGYCTHPARRYPVLYLLHGVPGPPGRLPEHRADGRRRGRARRAAARRGR